MLPVRDRIAICTKVGSPNDKPSLHTIQQKLAMLGVERKAVKGQITKPPPQLPIPPPPPP